MRGTEAPTPLDPRLARPLTLEEQLGSVLGRPKLGGDRERSEPPPPGAWGPPRPGTHPSSSQAAVHRGVQEVAAA